MARLEDIALLTGNKSISEMTDAELREHLHNIRVSRKTAKPKQFDKEQQPKRRSRRVTAEQKLLESMLPELSQDELAELLKDMEGQ